MTIDEWNDLTKEVVIASGDQGAMTALLTKATDAFSEELSGRVAAEEKVEKLTADNESLRSYNMDLFMRLSEQAKERSPQGNQKEPTEDDITIDDLFKE